MAILKLGSKISKGLVHPARAASLLRAVASHRAWLARLTGASKDDLEKYAQELRSEMLYERLVKSLDEAGARRGAMVGPFRAPLLYIICRALRPEILVETGTSSGLSTALILSALEKNGQGRLYSIDYPFDVHGTTLPPGRETGWLVPQHLRQRWELVIGKSQDKLPTLLKGTGQIDLFLHDSEHTYEAMLWEFKTAWPHLRPGGILLSDDVLWNRAFVDFCRHARPVYRKVFHSLGAERK
ncbi:MAG: class I SAM-dependent methyltransferase [Chloroflexi bacterium]|nr:class I SAM-dependent methyltransferase [Chloroflexota bacterium]